MSDASPYLSIIIPFETGEPRADASLLATWADEQTAPAETFEIVVMLGTEDPDVAARYRALVRPHDQVIPGASTDEMDLYVRGTQAARGSLFLFTENHCSADARCVEALLAFLEDTAYSGAFLKAEHRNMTDVALMEQRLYERHFATTWSNPDHWDHVRIRGFALYRDAYERIGGWEASYGLFAEPAMSASLHHHGLRIGYAEEAVVTHINTPRLNQVQEAIAGYTRGECRYRDAHDPAYCERYFGLPASWSRRAECRPETVRPLNRALARTLRRYAGRGPLHRRLGASWRLGRTWIGRLSAQAFGPRLFRGQAGVAVYQARLRYLFWRFNEPRRVDAFADLWVRLADAFRWSYVLSHPDASRPLPPALRYAVGDEPATRLIGFHVTERHNGAAFRWTDTVAAIRVTVPPAAYRVTIDTHALRGSTLDLPFALFFNGHPFWREDVVIDQGRISFSVEPVHFRPESHQVLTLVADPMRSREDPRALGLPVFSIVFDPLDAE